MVWGSLWVHFLDPYHRKLNQTVSCKGRDLLSTLSKGPPKADGNGHQSAYYSHSGYFLVGKKMRNSEPRGQPYLHHPCLLWDSARKCFPGKPHYFLLPLLSIKPHQRSWCLSALPSLQISVVLYSQRVHQRNDCNVENPPLQVILHLCWSPRM